MKLIPRPLRKAVFGLKPFDRRKHPRLKPDKEIPCFCVYEDSNQRLEFPVEIMNISKGGSLIITSEYKVYPGTKVELKFKPPLQQEFSIIKGKILRTFRPRHQYIYYSGIKFDEGNEKNIQLLIDSVVDQKQV